VPARSPFTDYLLRLLWIREFKFEKSALEMNGMFIFFLNAFILNDIEIDNDIVREELNVLLAKGYLQGIDEDYWQPGMASGSGWTTTYSLTLKGRKVAEKRMDTVSTADTASSTSPPAKPWKNSPWKRQNAESPSIEPEATIADLPVLAPAASSQDTVNLTPVVDSVPTSPPADMGYYVFVFDNAEETEFEHARGVIYIGELTDRQYSIFLTRFQKKYTGVYFATFVPSQQLLPDRETELKLLLADYGKLSGGRKRVLDTAVQIADEVRKADGCADKNIVSEFQEREQKEQEAFGNEAMTALLSAFYSKPTQAVSGGNALGLFQGVTRQPQEPVEVIVKNEKPISVRDSGTARDVLWAVNVSKLPEEKYRRWMMWKSGIGYMEIAKSEHPEWESEYGRAQALKMWNSEADTIRKQVQSVEKQVQKPHERPEVPDDKPDIF
jgi:hypothetical protein